jgi:uncharacterized membrane protein
MRTPQQPQPSITLDSLKEEISRIRGNSNDGHTYNADLNEVVEQREEVERQTKKIESVRVDIELKSLVNRIRGMTTQIKEKVKKHRELSESIISE